MAIKIDLSKSIDRPKIPIAERRKKTNRLFRKPLSVSAYRDKSRDRLVYDPTIERTTNSIVIANNDAAINQESARLALLSLNHGYLFQDREESRETQARNDLVNYDWSSVGQSTVKRKRGSNNLRAFDFLIECQYCKRNLPYHLSEYHKVWIWSCEPGTALKRAIKMYKAYAKPQKSACIYFIKPELIADRVEAFKQVFEGYID